MKNDFPPIYEDEMVYSWFCRYLIYNGIWSYSDITSELFRSKDNVISKLFIGNITEEVKNNIEKIIPINTLLSHHTMFYAHTAFCSQKYKNELLKKMEIDCRKAESLKYREDRGLKYCPLCVEEDKLNHNEAYWHCAHQIRGIKICYKHKCNLIHTNVKYYGFDKLEEYLYPLEIIYENNDIIWEYSRLYESLVEYTTDRFFKQDIKIKNMDYSVKRHTDLMAMREFYRKNDIFILKEHIQKMKYDKNKSFFTMCVIYYYFENICKNTLKYFP